MVTAEIPIRKAVSYLLILEDYLDTFIACHFKSKAFSLMSKLNDRCQDSSLAFTRDGLR